jgi:hypothetical protein
MAEIFDIIRSRVRRRLSRRRSQAWISRSKLDAIFHDQEGAVVMLLASDELRQLKGIVEGLAINAQEFD